VKTLVGISQILSLASSGFTEEHASSSGPQWRATLPAVFRQQRNRPTPRALAWTCQLRSTSPAASFVLHLKNQSFKAWQYIYAGVFSHTDTDNPTEECSLLGCDAVWLYCLLSHIVFLRSVLQLLVTAKFPSSLILFALMMEAIHSSETLVLTRATRRNIPGDGILQIRRSFPEFNYLSTMLWNLK
jgi:hypothetical protein